MSPPIPSRRSLGRGGRLLLVCLAAAGAAGCGDHAPPSTATSASSAVAPTVAATSAAAATAPGATAAEATTAAASADTEPAGPELVPAPPAAVVPDLVLGLRPDARDAALWDVAAASAGAIDAVGRSSAAALADELARGRVDVATLPLVDAVRLRAAGLPVHVIAPLEATRPATVILVRGRPRARSLAAALRGRTLGVESGSAEDLAARCASATVQPRPRLRDVGRRTPVAALAAGRVDAVAVPPGTSAPGARAFPVADGCARLGVRVLVATDTAIAARAAPLGALVGAVLARPGAIAAADAAAALAPDGWLVTAAGALVRAAGAAGVLAGTLDAATLVDGSLIAALAQGGA